MCAAFVAASACSPPDPSHFAVEVGTGETRFQPLATGDTVDIIRGPQGGFHIWIGARAKAPVDPRGAEVVYSILDAGGREVSINGQRTTLAENGEWFEVFGLFGFLQTPQGISGSDVTLRTEIRDAGGKRGTDERRVRARGP